MEEILGRGRLTPKQLELALHIFRRLAEAEAAVHGLPIEKVHFHEVGALDSIADITGAAVGLDLLGVERFTSRSVPTGHGMVQCAHGLMPIPAPATAELLKGVPLASSSIKAELTTPTGAAILRSVVAEWVETPIMTVERIGCGAGRREFVDQPNLLRLFVGTSASPTTEAESDQVWVLETNLDDVPAEVVGYCFRAVVRRRGVGRLRRADSDEKRSARRPTERDGGWSRSCRRWRRFYSAKRRRSACAAIRYNDESCGAKCGRSKRLGDRFAASAAGATASRPSLRRSMMIARVARLHGVALREVYAVVRRSYSENPV